MSTSDYVNITGSIIGALATLFVGVAVGVVAWLQKEVSHQQLQISLLERRYQVYQATCKFLGKLEVAHEFTLSDLVEFSAETVGASFLFDGKIVEFLAAIRKDATLLLVGPADGAGVLEQRQGDDRIRVPIEQGEVLARLNEVSAVFAAYLDFSTIRKPFPPKILRCFQRDVSHGGNRQHRQQG